ncbi:MAG: citrate/2-methylcitrate synthase, partial [Candidatus Latescibacterota bacterium]
IAGSNFVDLLELAREDPDTELVILNGEVGGSYEEDAAEYIRRTEYPKPVIGLVSGVGAEHFFPRGSRMGHAGAVVGEGETGTCEHKVAAFEAAGILSARSSDELVEMVGQVLRKTREDHLEEKDLRRPELVSIAKPKLESMKSQLRAVTVKTGITQLLDGQPYLLGYPLSDLIRHAPMEDILSMTLRRAEPKPKERSLLRRLFVYHMKNLPLSRAAIETAVQSFHHGNPLNAAVSAGLLAQEAVPVENLHEELKDAFSPQEAEALVITGWVILLAGRILGGDLHLEGNGRLENIFFRAVTGRAPNPGEADIFRGIFAACAEHTPAVPSSLAAIAAYSGGVSLKTALAAGITAMGDAHAGAGEGAAFAFQVEAANAPSGLSTGERAQWLVDRYAGKPGGEKRKIPGYGHRYYGLYGRDPRAEALLELAENNGCGGESAALARAVERILQEQKANGLCLNVDGAIGAVISEMGIPPAAGKALFIIPRSAGILGQLLEQKEGSFFRLSNDSVSYTGPAPRPYRETKRDRSEAEK